MQVLQRMEVFGSVQKGCYVQMLREFSSTYATYTHYTTYRDP